MQDTHQLTRAQYLNSQVDMNFVGRAWLWRVDIGNINFFVIHQLGDFKKKAGAIIHFDLQLDLPHFSRGSFSPGQYQLTTGQTARIQGMASLVMNGNAPIAA